MDDAFGILDAIASGLIVIKAEDGADKSCPTATRDISVNLRNRQKAINDAGYGPMNPKHANNDFWKKKASRWEVSPSEAKGQLCGNCAAFIKTPRMLKCIDEGLEAGGSNSGWDVIDKADLGYCEAFDFKCAASRTCDAWIVGGPITEEKTEQETKVDSFSQSSKEDDVDQYLDSLSDDELDAMFPEDELPTDDEAKWLFDVGGAFLRRSITNRRRKRKRRWKDDYEDIDEKGARKPLRDPKGGLTAAGRAYFKRTEGSNLKPGVRGPADTPEKMRRKGSFLVRFFTNPRGPMKDEKGRPTRLALSAAAWGEPVPQNAESAKKLAEKGRRLLDRYRRYQESKKKSLDDFTEVKALGSTIGQSRGTADTQERRIGNKPGASAPRGNYDPKARDADGDGTVQEGTDYARPVEDKKKTQRTGSADSRERQAEADERKRTGKGQGFDRLETPAEIEAYRRSQGLPPSSNAQTNKERSADKLERDEFAKHLRKLGFTDEVAKKFGEWMKQEANKLKPGEKTNWLPGRLPNGGRIAEDGTYISADMVRRDDKTQSDFYKARRSKPASSPNKPKPGSSSNSGRAGSADAMERWSGGPRPAERPSRRRSQSADSMERREEQAERKRTGKGQGFDKLTTPQDWLQYYQEEEKRRKRRRNRLI